MNSEFFPFVLYGTLKQLYIGPTVDLACDNVRLLFSSMEKTVPTISSQVQVVHGVPEVDIVKLPEEDAIGHVIAAQLGTETTYRQVKKPGPVWQHAISAELGLVFAKHHKVAFVDNKIRENRAAASLDPGIRRAPSSTATKE